MNSPAPLQCPSPYRLFTIHPSGLSKGDYQPKSSLSAPCLPPGNTPIEDLPPFVQRIAEAFSTRQALLAYARHVAIGGRDVRPTLPLATHWIDALDGTNLIALRDGNPWQADATPSSDTHYRSFPASVLCYESHLAEFRYDWERSSRLFLLRLPDSEHQEILANCSDGPRPTVPEAFGYLRYTTQSDGSICILEIHNELFGRLTSSILKEQYQDWAVELLDGFTQYVARAADIVSVIVKPEDAQRFNKNLTRTIIIPPASMMEERYGDLDCGRPTPWAQQNEDGLWYLPGIDTAQIVERYVEAPTRLGFEQQTLEGSFFANKEELPRITEGLILKVLSPHSDRVVPKNTLITELLHRCSAAPPASPSHNKLDYFKRAAEVLSSYINGGDIESPRLLRTLSVPSVRPNALTLAPSFEVAPAFTVSLEEIIPPSLVQGLREKSPEFASHLRELTAVLNRLIDPNFTVISRGFQGGMADDWAELPDPELPPGCYLFFVQAPHQNRHPSIRVVVVDDSKNHRMYYLGIKGAGIAELGGWPVHKPGTGERAPIYRTEGKDSFDRAPWWGGLTSVEALEEARYSLALATHLAEFLPHLADRALIPLRLSLPTMLPTWSESDTSWQLPEDYATTVLSLGRQSSAPPEIHQGESPKEASDRTQSVTIAGGEDLNILDQVVRDTETLPSAPDEAAIIGPSNLLEDYPVEHLVVPEASPQPEPPPPELATLISTFPSDVRIHTFFDRIFNGPRNQDTPFDPIRDINKTMRFLYNVHGFSLNEPTEQYVPPDLILDPPAICEYLAIIAELNKENAQEIYRRVCGDTLAIIESVHHRGGHLGGGRIEPTLGVIVGARNGGVTAMRNIDIGGGNQSGKGAGMHDVSALCYFPWMNSPRDHSDDQWYHQQYLNTLQAFDLSYWAEMEQCMRIFLTGAPYEKGARWIRHQLTALNDVTLYSAAPSTSNILAAAKLIQEAEQTRARVSIDEVKGLVIPSVLHLLFSDS
jgi:hypothetical protein